MKNLPHLLHWHQRRDWWVRVRIVISPWTRQKWALCCHSETSYSLNCQKMFRPTACNKKKCVEQRFFCIEYVLDLKPMCYFMGGTWSNSTIIEWNQTEKWLLSYTFQDEDWKKDRNPMLIETIFWQWFRFCFFFISFCFGKFFGKFHCRKIWLPKFFFYFSMFNCMLICNFIYFELHQV